MAMFNSYVKLPEGSDGKIGYQDLSTWHTLRALSKHHPTQLVQLLVWIMCIKLMPIKWTEQLNMGQLKGNYPKIANCHLCKIKAKFLHQRKTAGTLAKRKHPSCTPWEMDPREFTGISVYHQCGMHCPSSPLILYLPWSIFSSTPLKIIKMVKSRHGYLSVKKLPPGKNGPRFITLWCIINSSRNIVQIIYSSENDQQSIPHSKSRDQSSIPLKINEHPLINHTHGIFLIQTY